MADADFPFGVVDEGMVLAAEQHHVFFGGESAVGVVVNVVCLR
ncbi:hypothetical protein [Sciscionella sediminilitoris]